MAFQINPSIPLQAMANPINIGESFAKAQTYQANALKLQSLRDKFDEEKAEKLRQKQMRQGMASELQKMQQGTPAQYRTTFPQTMPTGQMPQGMTGVLANERGQNMPQPALFGENILQGNFDINREMVSPAVAGREPSYLEQLQIAAKHALQSGDVETAFKYSQAIQQQRVAEREQNAPVGNPYPTYDAKGNFVGTRIMTKSGQEVAFGQQGTTTVKPDVLTAKDKAQQQFQREQQAALFEQQRQLAEINANKQREIALLKPDPVTQSLTIAEGKEEIKRKSEQRAKVAEKYADAESIKPILQQLITQLDEIPQSGLGRDVQSGLEYFGVGSQKKQNALAALKNTEALLVPFAQKQSGPQSDKDVQQYREQVAAASNPLASASSRKAAAQNALLFADKIIKKHGNYASKILSGEITPDELKEQSKPTRTKDELFQLKKEYEFNRKKYKDDPEALKILDSKARELGLIK